MARINVRLEVEGRIPEQTSLHAIGCPFCGYNETLDLAQPNRTTLWAVVCPECHSKGPLKCDVSLAITTWNVRR